MCFPSAWQGVCRRPDKIFATGVVESHDLPSRYPPYQTCHRRFQLWQRSGRLDRLLQRLAEDLRDRGKIDLSEAFVDATFASAKKGALNIYEIAFSRRGSTARLASLDACGRSAGVGLDLRS